MALCRSTTREGKPCPIDARPSGLCHVHDPEVQCGAPLANEKRCTAPTGGKRCPRHADPAADVAAALDEAVRAVDTAIAAGVDRRTLVEAVRPALLRIRERVWPDAAPATLPHAGSTRGEQQRL